MDRITLPNGITIESTPVVQEDNFEISQEAFDLLNTYSAESILEAFVACESSGLYSVESEDEKEELYKSKTIAHQLGKKYSKIGATIGSIAGSASGGYKSAKKSIMKGDSKKKAALKGALGALGGGLGGGLAGGGLGYLKGAAGGAIGNQFNKIHYAQKGKNMSKAAINAAGQGTLMLNPLSAAIGAGIGYSADKDDKKKKESAAESILAIQQ